jgi:hypothetical protein
MLYILTNILQFQEFLEYFKQTHGTSKLLDLSKVPISKLSEESMSVVNHHSECGVFLGYLEPGWMLESAHQVQLRKLIRKFPVAMISKFVDSIPFSWKNETHSIYTQVPLNHHIREDGSSKVVNDGSSVHHESQV